MPVNIIFEGDVVILSNFNRLMNDPRYVDAGRDIQELLEQGRKKFVLDLGGVRETGSSFLGLLMTITRRIQRRGGEVVLGHLSRQVEELLETMQMEDFWDVFPNIKEAVESFRHRRTSRAPKKKNETIRLSQAPEVLYEKLLSELWTELPPTPPTLEAELRACTMEIQASGATPT